MTPAGRRSGGRRLAVLVTVLAVATAGLVASAAGIAGQLLPRRFSAAQQQQIATWEVARRWRALPAGEIFPVSVQYQLTGSGAGPAGTGLRLTAARVAIASAAACAAGADPAAARLLEAGRCEVMLRATYADETDSMLVTIGVAVMPGRGAARRAAAALAAGHQQPAGVRAAAFGRTLAEAFGDQQRQLSAAVSAGPYVILTAAGYSDGRPQQRVSSDPYAEQEMTSFADGVSRAVGTLLGAMPPPPGCPGAPGC